MTHAQGIEVSHLLYRRGIGHTLGVDPSSGHASVEVTDLAMPEDELLGLVSEVHALGLELVMLGGRLCILRT